MINRNNKAVLIGIVTKPQKFEYRYKEKEYFRIEVSIKRDSGVVDKIPVVTDSTDEIYGKRVIVIGEFRSRNITYAERSHLILYVFSDNIKISDCHNDYNDLEIEGFITKELIYRLTAKTKRKICDLMIAVNRSYSRWSDYIPTITWGENAIYSSEMQIGTKVKIRGRIQSREYKKTIDGQIYIKTAYELSAYVIEVHNEDKDD